MFALPVILIFTILLITIQIPIICTLYYSQNYMLKMLSIKLSINMESHPLRVRGLKLRLLLIGTRVIGSHPLRVRGLKLQKDVYFGTSSKVASFTGAWIETIIFSC